MDQTLTITGSRPGSSFSSRPSSASHRQGYRTISRHSEADEMLFSSIFPKKYDKSYNTHLWSVRKELAEKKPQPLLWAPSPCASARSDSARSMTPVNTYRRIAYKPSYVDETLFGSKLVEPSFKAPWNQKTNRWTPDHTYIHTEHSNRTKAPVGIDGSNSGTRFNETTYPSRTVKTGAKKVWK